MRSKLQLGHHRVLRLRCSDIDLSGIRLVLLFERRLARCTGNPTRLGRMLGRRRRMQLLHHEKIMRYGHRRRLLIRLPRWHLNLRHIN